MVQQQASQQKADRRARRAQERKADKIEATVISMVFSGAAGIGFAFGGAIYSYSESMKPIVRNPEFYDIGIGAGVVLSGGSAVVALGVAAYKSNKAKIKKVALPLAFAAFSAPAAIGHHMTSDLIKKQDISNSRVSSSVLPSDSIASLDKSYIAPHLQQ